MKKILTSIVLMAGCLFVKAGGLMTNTNYHIAFDRMFARGATFDIDAAYSNPAGLAWGHEGWLLSFNWQMPTQNRDIETTFPLFPYAYGADTHKFKGEASAPFVPGLFASYKKDRWALSTMIGIVGSGGYVKYDEGVPMFTAPLMAMFAGYAGLTPDQYTIDAKMKGKQYIYGGQLNFTYRLLDCLSAAAGLRANYYDGYYRGSVIADHAQLGNLVSLNLDADQKGWGFTPLISVDFHKDKLTLSARYELRTKINVPNETNRLDADLGQAVKTTLAQTNPQALAAIGTVLNEKLAAYEDGAKTRYDMPALLSLAAQYELTPNLRAAVEYHWFDDTHAKMANDRQKQLTHGTHEVLAGVEWDINKRFTVSCGGQRTDYGLRDDYQQHTSFACDSYSVGLGGAVNINDHMRLNLSYFCTLYSDYTKQSDNYSSTGLNGRDSFSRTNGVFGIGIDYKF